MTKQLLAAIVLSGMCPSVANAQRGQATVVTEYMPPPTTVEAFFQASDLVVIATLQSPTYRTDERKSLTTHFKADVAEVLKNAGKGPLSSVIDVYRFGGRRQTDTGFKDVDELHFGRWSQGMKLLMFLNWNDRVGEYVPMGPDLAFQLDPISGKVRAFGRGKVAKAWHGRDIAHVIAEAKAAKGKGGPR